MSSVDDSPKFVKFWRHLRVNKHTYLVGAGCLTMGAVGSFALCEGLNQIKQVGDSFKFVRIRWKSPNINITMNLPEPVQDETTSAEENGFKTKAHVNRFRWDKFTQSSQ